MANLWPGFFLKPRPGVPQGIPTGKIRVPTLYGCGKHDSAIKCNHPYALKTKDYIEACCSPFTSIYLHLPPFTSIYLHLPPFTPIHPHSPPLASTYIHLPTLQAEYTYLEADCGHGMLQPGKENPNLQNTTDAILVLSG